MHCLNQTDLFLIPLLLLPPAVATVAIATAGGRRALAPGAAAACLSLVGHLHVDAADVNALGGKVHAVPVKAAVIVPLHVVPSARRPPTRAIGADQPASQRSPGTARRRFT